MFLECERHSGSKQPVWFKTIFNWYSCLACPCEGTDASLTIVVVALLVMAIFICPMGANSIIWAYSGGLSQVYGGSISFCSSICGCRAGVASIGGVGCIGS